MGDINDIFDNILMFEDRCLERGFVQGLEEGKRRGREDGRSLGFTKGVEIGSEVGFYRGCVDSALRLCQFADPTQPPTRRQKVLMSLDRLLEEFPSSNVTSLDHLQKLEDIRAKFRQLQAILETKKAPKKPATSDDISY